MKTRQQSKTDAIELVETHVLSQSLKRLYDGRGGYDSNKWKRALYHALAIAGNSHEQMRKIREALELP